MPRAILPFQPALKPPLLRPSLRNQASQCRPFTGATAPTSAIKNVATNSDPSFSSARKTNIGSAVLSTPEQLKILTQTRLITAVIDLLQAKGEEFVQGLQVAGVLVTFFSAGADA
jgi:hypothetical protein